MSFTVQDVQTLRERTGVGMMECKKALTEANGDMEKAIEVLRERGLAAAAKKAGRIAAEGIVWTVTDELKNVSCIIEVNSETDFVAKNQVFIDFVDQCAKTVIEFNPKDVDELMNCTGFGSDLTIGELLRDKILTIGENLKIRRFDRIEGVVTTYIHGGGRIGVTVKFDVDTAVSKKSEFKDFAKDIAMQVAAAIPAYLDKESVPADVIEKEKEILTAQAINEGKPASIAEKMVLGRISKFYKDACLLEQPFIKDGDVSVTQYISNKAKELGTSIKVLSFNRFEKGEGLQKREDNFADEVAKMVK